MFDKSNRLSQQAHTLIPGGCHTYAKGDDQFPLLSPKFIAKGKGCHVWDVDGNEFIEYGMGLRSVTLGHAEPRIIEAAYEQMQGGSNFTRPAAIEVSCAEKLLQVIPTMDQVKFSKDGSTVTSAAVKLARAYTGRDFVVICTDDPFISYDDWYFSKKPMSAGIPALTGQYTLEFSYNDITSLEVVFAKHPNQIACVIMEAARIDEPMSGFLAQVKSLCHDNGALLIFDEMITGFRWHLQGAQHVYSVTPDLCTFGKALANGFSLSALLGKRDIMELGGIRTDRERVFLLSTTHGAETHALAAAIKTIEIYQTEAVVEQLYAKGERLQTDINDAIDNQGLADYFQIVGRACNLVYVTRDKNRNPSQIYRTLFLQELIKHGILAPSFVISTAHSSQDIEKTVHAVSQALKIYSRALEDGIDQFVVGESVKPAIRTHK